ncbi:MAG TPA: hypothetical protein VFP84_40905 [Kofleriaceae bacterium]|nr:hypothetical protein [Kofleriaceae bacterium]
MRALVVLLALAACDAGASPDPGYAALLQIPGAQYRPGPLPAPDGGPDALFLRLSNIELTIGETRQTLDGALGPGSRAAIVGLAGGDDGWVLPAGVPAFELPDNPTLKGPIGLADDFPPGPFTITMIGIDAAGRYGQPASVDVNANVAPPPAGQLVIALDWLGAADLDLHVVDPLGGEAYAGKPNTYSPPPPGEPADPNGFLTGGILDLDANQGCHRDGRPAEHVVWQMTPPPGAYTVRVEARDLCGDASAGWAVSAFHDGARIGAARGVATEDEVQLSPHGAGAGALALRFTL